MSPTSKALSRNPPLAPAADFYGLRREGIGLIAQMGSGAWTDYNVHDPGVTMLEALCYAITDLAYRIGWPIEDLLAPPTPSADPKAPYPDQTFFTARRILTVNPVTPDDFRRLLIDLDGVRNAWILLKDCACDGGYFAWCAGDVLTLAFADPKVTPPAVEVAPRGLYEALLELEDDPELGNLNDRKLEATSVIHDAAGPHVMTMELRFPDISLTNRDQWNLFLGSETAFTTTGGITVTLTSLRAAGAESTFDVFTDLATDAERDAYVHAHWRGLFYASLEIGLVASGKAIVFADAALRLLGDVAAKNAATAQGLKATLQDVEASGFARRYHRKAARAHAAVEAAKASLQGHRNLDEDYCRVTTVGVNEVAACADIEVAPDADIERVQAQIWFEIEQVLNAPLRFHTLQELRDGGTPVEEIFDGPELDHGFLRADELAASALAGVVRVSDIVTRLMSIEGVNAVNQLSLTKYDAEGNPVPGAADPTWVDGAPVFDPKKLSASWLLYIDRGHQPRLYRNLSRFLFFKSGLPFLPRMDEANDVWNQILGDAERAKFVNAATDLPIPTGQFRAPEDYFPVQHSFPLAYGVGPNGLPSVASPARRAQANQLKAYLLVFEQLLANALAQLAHTADLFSLDPALSRTYFVRAFDDASIAGFGALAQPGLTPAALGALAETQNEFYARRNRFLDHLLARFGEDFAEYALVLTNAAGERAAQPRLIENKLSFLRRYPEVSHDRAKAFDYSRDSCADGNDPGIKRRVRLLLGDPDLGFGWQVGAPTAGTYPVAFQLLDGNGRRWLGGSLAVSAASAAGAQAAAYRALVRRMVLPDAYAVVAAGAAQNLVLNDQSAAEIGRSPEAFVSVSDALAARDVLATWAANERLIVVEHLLLRPKFPGDALYPACTDGACVTCGGEDPYSFRLTIVMPGWAGPYVDNLDLRRFAERTIQQETPAHLLEKTCWVGNDGFVEDECDEVVGTLGDLLVERAKLSGDDACACARAIYHVFSVAFAAWYADKTLEPFHPDALPGLVEAWFVANVTAADIPCATAKDPTLWADVLAAMVAHFAGVARLGWQFERFERAWCEWLDANAAIDWTEERLFDRVQAILTVNRTGGAADAAALCTCAKSIVTTYGTAFFAWMRANLVEGRKLADFSPFVAPAVTPCQGATFEPGTFDALGALLAERYDAYRDVSDKLWVVLQLLSKLRNTYPAATLHDCDDGSDHNPVRLGSTALGNTRLRTGPS